MYINLLVFQAPSCKDAPNCTRVEILFEEEEPLIIYPYLLEGGQRLLVPDEVSQQLISRLKDDCSFIIRIGRSQIHVIPDNFLPSYDQLMALNVKND